MQVIATAQGFDGIQLREPGEKFTMPDDIGPASWFVPVGKDGKPIPWSEAQLEAQREARAADGLSPPLPAAQPTAQPGGQDDTDELS